MTDAPALLLAGVGLSFLGLDLLTSTLQESTSRTLRALIRQSTRSRPTCAAVGFAAGVIVQSTSAVASVLGSMVSAGMTTIRQAIPIVAFANVGTTVLVFAGSLDIRFAVLLLVGASSIGHSLAREFRWKAAAAAALGVGLVLYGGDLMMTTAGSLQDAGWFSAFLRTWHGSMPMAFALGCLASFLTQSTTVIALMTLSIAKVGLIDGAAALAMLYGANLGSTLMRMILTRGSSGAQRQVSRFQDLFKLVGTIVFVAWLAAERLFDVPGMHAAVSRLPMSLPIALASANLAFNGTIALVASACVAPLARFVVRRWPSDGGHDLGTPMYAVPEAVADAATAIDLLEKEQARMIQGTREYMTAARLSGNALERGAAAGLHRRFMPLFGEISHFQSALVSKQLDARTSTWLGNVQGRQQVIELLEDSLHHLTVALEEPWRGKTLASLIENMVEALDFLLICADDAATTLEHDPAELLFSLSDDRSDMMARVRNLHLAPDRALSSSERALLLRLTSLFERIVWMVQRYAELLLRSVDAENGGRRQGARGSEVGSTAQLS